MTSNNLFKFGNHKIHDNTLIFNMGSAHLCPSACLNLCTVKHCCYARSDELMYPHVIEYRIRQMQFWSETRAEDIANIFIKAILKRRKETRYFRYNESGDFLTEGSIGKLNIVAGILKRSLGIITYGYTARIDLFKEFLNKDKLNFIVKLSGYRLDGMNSTIVVDNKDKKSKFILNNGWYNREKGKTKIVDTIDIRHNPKKDFVLCPFGNKELNNEYNKFKCMKDCTMCASKDVNIAFKKH